ncbi:MAG: hypothetical protein WD055_04015 [Candidatus Dependentiae bacterium]
MINNKRVASFLFLLLSSYPYTQTENVFGRTFKNWISSRFGIDANEPLVHRAFNPTIENLNTITLIPTEYDQNGLSVAELAQQIDTGNDANNPLYLTLQTNDTVSKTWRVHFGLDVTNKEDTVFVYSRGYAGAERPEKPRRNGKEKKKRGLCAIPKRGGGVVVGSQWLKNSIINGQCVMFDYPDTRSYFDFGLKNDQNCLDTMYNALVQRTENIVFFGNCRGSKALLNFLSRSQPEHVRAVVLDAPFLDLVQFTQEIGKTYAKRIPFSKDIAYKIITYWHPSYHESDDLSLNDLKQIPTQTPIFIGHLYHDALVSDELIKQMVTTLRDSGHAVYLLVIDDHTKSHSRLYQTEPFVKAVNAFFKKYNLPHDAILAHEGRFLLANATYNTKNIDNWSKDRFPYVYKNR